MASPSEEYKLRCELLGHQEDVSAGTEARTPPMHP